jgi:hypothetical protein
VRQLLLFVAFLLSSCIRPYPGGSQELQAALTQAAEPLPTAAAPQASLEPVFQPTRTPSASGQGTPPGPGPAFSGSQLYAVVMVAEDNVLNVRTAPGIDNPILETLPPNSRDLRLTGGRQTADGAEWWELSLTSGSAGWASAAFLTQQVPSEAFCADPRVKARLLAFVEALQKQNGPALMELISPIHGLTVRHNWWNPEVVFSAGQAGELFEDQTSYNWGAGEGSALPIQGSFAAVILPRLQDVFSGPYQQPCNNLEINVASGPTTGQVIWPFEYANLNYIALYRPAAPGDELNWRTWAVGFEIIDGIPYVLALVQYYWEI